MGTVHPLRPGIHLPRADEAEAVVTAARAVLWSAEYQTPESLRLACDTLRRFGSPDDYLLADAMAQALRKQERDRQRLAQEDDTLAEVRRQIPALIGFLLLSAVVMRVFLSAGGM